MALVLKYKDEDEDYFGCYARVLGPIDRYAKMTNAQLGRRWKDVRREFGAALIVLRHEPDSITAKMILDLVEPHDEAIVKEIRRRHGIDVAATDRCRKALQAIDAEARV